MKPIFAILVLAAWLGAAEPELLYNPACPDLQPVSPPSEGGATGVGAPPSIVWNGREYATLWADGDSTLSFRRIFADGSPAGPVVKPLPGYYYVPMPYETAMVWNGAGYGIAFLGHDGSTYQAYFARLDEAGALLPVGAGDPPNPQRVSFLGVAPTTENVGEVDLAWSGAGYIVAWTDYRNAPTGPDVFCTLLGADGWIGGGGNTLHDLTLCDAASVQQNLAIAYSSSNRNYLIAWVDLRNGANFQIYSRAITQNGSLDSERPSVTGSTNTGDPALVASGNRFGLAWIQPQAAVNQVFFRQLYNHGGPITPATQVTWGAFQCVGPFLTWTGVEYGLFFQDNDGSAHFLTYYQRITALGAPMGGQALVSSYFDLTAPRAAFGRYGYMHTAAYGINYLTPLGCWADTTPPTCPLNLLAYNITGDAATVSWLPSTEDYTDIAYYQVYRDNIPLARTANNYWRDTGLDLSTTYNYSVRPVNAAQMENGACAESIYLKTNASLILKMDKSTPDAHLFWTDGGMNNYNIFRGTSPQVMQKIGSTADLEAADPEVLLDGVTYYYTVDDPGQ